MIKGITKLLIKAIEKNSEFTAKDKMMKGEINISMQR